MKKLILIFALLISIISYGQITKFQVAGYEEMTTTERDGLIPTEGWQLYNTTDKEYQYWDGTVWVSVGIDQNLNNQFNINATYTTLLADENKKGIVLGGDIILDASLLPAEYDIRFVNNSGVQINITIAAGQNVLNGQTIPDVLEQGYYMYAEVINSTVWSIIVGKAGGSGGATNLDYIPSTTDGVITSDTGTDATIPLVGANAGLSSPADKVKIDASIGGSIADTHIGVGDINGDIIGSNDLTWDDTNNSLKINDKVYNTYFKVTEATTTNDRARASFTLGSDGNLINSRLWIIPDVPSGTYVSNGLEILNSEDTTQSLTKRFGLTISETSALIQSTSMNGTIDGAAIGFTTLGTLVSQMTLEQTGQLTLPANPTLDTHVGNRGYNDGRYGQLATNNTWLADQTANNFISQNNFILKPIATGTNDFVINKSGNNIQINSASGEMLFNTVNTNTARFGGVLYTTTLFADLPITTMSIAEINVEGPRTLVSAEWVQAQGGGGLDNIVEDTTPQLGGDLDTNSKDIKSSDGNTALQLISNGSFMWKLIDLNSKLTTFKVTEFATGLNDTMLFDFDYGGAIDFGWDLYRNGTSTTNSFRLNFIDDFEFNNAKAIGVRLDTEAKSTTSTLLSTELNQTIFSTSATSVTYTIPDTLTENGGTHITFIAEGAGDVIIAVSGTATINGGTASITISGATASKVNAVQLIQKTANSNDWIAIGGY